MSTAESASLDSRWREYQTLPNLREHWYWRPGWRVGRSFYTWHLTFDQATDVHPLVTCVQRHLDLPCVDLVPMSGLHLTMQGVGFADEVSDEDLEAIVDAARTRLAELQPFPLQLGPVDPDAEGVGLLIRPWAPVVGLRSAIRDAIGSVWTDVPEPETGFRPHVTIAYSASDAPVHELRRRLGELRSLPPATTRIGEAQLIRLSRDDRNYTWKVYATVVLGR
jgi:2'-5' RNA ligase